MDGRQYGQPGPFGRALERAIAADAKRPRPVHRICGVDGCGLRSGHVERAGTQHHPVLSAGACCQAATEQCDVASVHNRGCENYDPTPVERWEVTSLEWLS